MRTDVPAAGGLDRPVFVVGPPRSGTTLLRVILSRHPRLHIATETHFADRWLERFPAMLAGGRDAFERYWTAFTATDAFWYLGIEPDPVCDLLKRWDRWEAGSVLAAIITVVRDAHGADGGGEKTPDHAQHLDRLLAWFPGGRVLYMIRDPRAVVASELRLDRDWASDDPDVAAQRWCRSTEPWLRWRDDPRVLTVRYEDLIREPRATVGRICAHVGLDPDPALLSHGGGHDSYRHGDRDPWGPLNRSALDAWRPVLDAGSLAAVADVCGRLCGDLGYPHPLEGLDAWERRVVGGHRARRRLVAAARRLDPRGTR